MRKFAVLVFVLFCITGCVRTETVKTVTVVAVQNGGLTISSDNPIEVRRGETAVFSVEVPDGFTVVCDGAEAVYNGAEGIVTVRNVVYPTTVKLSAVERESVRLMLTTDGSGQIVSDKSDRLDIGETVSLSAEAEPGNVFLGYSIGESLKNGGAFLSADTEYSYTVESADREEPETAKDPLVYPNQNEVDIAALCEGSELRELGAVYTAASNMISPQGGGSRDLGVIVDGIITGGDTTGQYDTFLAQCTDGLDRIWFGVRFDKTYEVSSVVFFEGGHWGDGGWFGSAPSVQLFIEGEWTDADAVLMPDYPEDSREAQGEINEAYVFQLGSVTECNGFRVLGPANSLAGHASCSELQAYGFLTEAGEEKVSEKEENVIWVYANFAEETDTILKYDLNGGHYACSDSTQYIQAVKQTFHLCPNALPDTGRFVREGYVLAGYNTESDGSGTFYAPGWNVVLPEGESLKLYAVWLEETSAEQFVRRATDSGVMITGYTGGACEKLVLPQFLDGLPVIAVAQGAFTNVSCEEVFIPRTVKNIEVGAFRNCSFSVCRFSDSVTSVSDQSFDSCPNFSTLIISAVREPTYQGTQHGSYAIKYEKLLTTASPKMVITSGSSSAYGFLSAQFIERLAEAGYPDWNVVNYACHFETPGTFFIDVISHFMKEGDVLLHSPEPLTMQLGSRDITAVMWQFFEGAYEAFSLVDIREYHLLFNSFAEFNSTRAYMPATSYEDHWEGVNSYGDVDYYKTGQYDGYLGGQGVFNFNTVLIDPDALNTVYDRVHAAGAEVWLTYAPINEAAVLTPSRNRQIQEEYMQFMRDNLNVVVISDVGDQIWKGRYMHDTNLHLSTEGAQLRTDMIAQDFIRQLEVEEP